MILLSPVLHTYFFLVYCSSKFLTSLDRTTPHLQDTVLCDVTSGHWERCAVTEGHAITQGHVVQAQEAVTYPWAPDAILCLLDSLFSFLVNNKNKPKTNPVKALLAKYAASALTEYVSVKSEAGWLLRGWQRDKFIQDLNRALGYVCSWKCKSILAFITLCGGSLLFFHLL